MDGTSAGGGDYFNLRGADVLNLEHVVRDPQHRLTTFVLIHGGYPYDREAILLASMKNVYLDSSATALLTRLSDGPPSARRRCASCGRATRSRNLRG